MDELTRCEACGRHPIVGETVTVHVLEDHESAVCDLCRSKPRVRMLGEAAYRERIRSASGAASVRRIDPVPVGSPARVPPVSAG
jgi:hypothetical protein